MSEHTPDRSTVRDYYIDRRTRLTSAAGFIPPTLGEAYAEYDRWHAEVIRAAKVEALRAESKYIYELIDLGLHDPVNPGEMAEQLNLRADRIERGDDER